MLVEPYAGDAVEENLNPVGRLSMRPRLWPYAELPIPEVGLGLGAQAGEERLRRSAQQAGFKTAARTRTPVNLVLEVVR